MAKKKVHAEQDESIEVPDAVAAAQRAQTPTEREKRICHLFASWEAAVKALAEERKRRTEDVAAAQAGLRSVVEQGVAAGDDAGRLRKLTGVEQAWQHLDERKAERVEALKMAKTLVESADKRLRDAIENSKQLSLFGASEDADAPLKFDPETGEVFG